MVKKMYFAADVILMTICGCLLGNAFELSGEAAWSFVISSVNDSPFEIVKPYALVFIMWTFIELSCMRPRLLHFVSVRILSLFVLVFLSVFALLLFREHLSDGRVGTAVMFVSVVTAETVQVVLYKSRVRVELFFAVLLTGFAVLFFALIFCSFYPPHCSVFFDVSQGLYGIKRS